MQYRKTLLTCLFCNSPRLIAGISGGNLVACGLQRLADRRANAPRLPLTNATRAMSNSSVVDLL